MISGIPAREDSNLERLYAQARRYDLLSAEQEREIDQRKWTAIRQLLQLLVAAPNCRHYLMRWSSACLEPLPDIERFKHREDRLLLRREMTDYLPGGSNADELTQLSECFSTGCSGEVLLNGLLQLSLPASFVVGMAESVTHRGSEKRGGKVAAALQAWERQWPPESTAGMSLPAPATVKSLTDEVEHYTEARDKLIMHNLRLVYSIAGRNRNKGAAFLDLVQEGTLGLLRAAEKFQFERGYRFSTYAFNWIQQGVKRHLADAAGAIRYPSHVQEQLGKVYGDHCADPDYNKSHRSVTS